MSASHPDIALPEPPGCLSRLIDWVRSLSDFSRVPETPLEHAIAALLVHAATMRGPMSQARHGRIEALLRGRLGDDEQAIAWLIGAAEREDDHAVDLHHFARVVNRALSQEGRLAVLDMAAQVAFAEDAGAEEEGFLRLLGGLLGISDHERGIVQHRARTIRQALSSPSPSKLQAKESRHA